MMMTHRRQMIGQMDHFQANWTYFTLTLPSLGAGPQPGLTECNWGTTNLLIMDQEEERWSCSETHAGPSVPNY